jgi:hypothetical protein
MSFERGIVTARSEVGVLSTQTLLNMEHIFGVT